MTFDVRPITRVAHLLACAVVVVWAFAGLLSAHTLSALESVEALSLALIFAGAVFLWRRPARLAQSSSARVFAVACFCAGAWLLAPAFHRSVAAGICPGGISSWLVPGIFGLLLWLVLPRAAPAGSIGDVEKFLRSAKIRLHLAAFAIIAVTAGLALSGLPLRAVLQRSLGAAALLLALRPLLDLAHTRSGVQVLTASMVLALLIAAGCGGAQYARLCAKVEAGNALLAKAEVDLAAAKLIHDEARQLNKVVFVKGPELSIESHWAMYYERVGAYWDALKYWRQVADMQRLDRTEFGPALRVQYKLGDSVSAWRKFIFKGFEGISHPDLLSGIKSMSEIGDVRARLLAALLAWQNEAPEDERRRLCQNVQALAPGEPTSALLLERLGAPRSEHPMALPVDLLVGSKPTTYSVLGTLNELGQLRTVVLLDPGTWELSVRARATPLDEIWPVLRVEFNGEQVGRSDVKRAEDHQVVFTFEVKRGDLYQVGLIFENRQQEMVLGRMTMRGLEVSGVTLQRVK